MVPRWRFLATFLRPVFADIQFAAAEIRRGKKKEEKEQTTA